MKQRSKMEALKKKLAGLREQHTRQSAEGKWVPAQTTRNKIVDVLNQLTKNYPEWRE